MYQHAPNLGVFIDFLRPFLTEVKFRTPDTLIFNKKSIESSGNFRPDIMCIRWIWSGRALNTSSVEHIHDGISFKGERNFINMEGESIVLTKLYRDGSIMS